MLGRLTRCGSTGWTEFAWKLDLGTHSVSEGQDMLTLYKERGVVFWTCFTDEVGFCQSLPLCLCKLLSADQTVASAIPPSISAMPTFDKSSWRKLEPAFNEHINSNQTASMSASQIESIVFDGVVFFFGFSFVFEDSKMRLTRKTPKLPRLKVWSLNHFRLRGQNADAAGDAALALRDLLQGSALTAGLPPEATAHALLRFLRRHPTDVDVQGAGCSALHQLCEKFPELRTTLRRDPSVYATVRAAVEVNSWLEGEDWYPELCVWLQPPCLVWRGRYRWGVGQDGPVVLTWSHLNSTTTIFLTDCCYTLFGR